MALIDCIVLTGAAGRLGRSLRPALAASCRELRVLDQSPLAAGQANETALQLDLNDQAALASALAGASAVVHFAGYPREADWPTLLAANVAGVASLWEAARTAGVQRIIYAGSNHSVGMYPRSEKLSQGALPGPDSRYGVTKVFMEAVASLYAAKHGLRGFGIRIGHCAPQPSDARMLSHWIHPEDLSALVQVGLRAEYENEYVYGVSNNSRSWWSNDRAEALGYRPAHSADAFIDSLQAQTSASPVAEHFQGGSFAAAEFDNPRFRAD
ncbi:NAD(P)-dependent oxidoreductase [Polaromonas sp. CG_9.11]|uniref:NAD-dependent epimerase/dehydratase family protein n=1 Tax=Polaromonas sp. CG_9.11 TaxID=2787730 RepID=UPI0018CA4C27|nr:NAD(P)-dependent oxidoreductase [Polaromonas sp. CG_9.11]MBG6077251.1 uronate dehydrogenase [Polaromonas sp. CG_9.11]